MRTGKWILVGVLATLTMDLGGALLRKTGLVAGLDPHVIGRWFVSVAAGHPFHHTILDAPPAPRELPIAFGAHYAIGITLALLLSAVLTVLPLRTAPGTSMAVAFGYGLLTNLLPWLIMFPAMGFGWFGSSGPSELALFRSSFAVHAVFGMGLALWGRVLGVLGEQL